MAQKKRRKLLLVIFLFGAGLFLALALSLPESHSSKNRKISAQSPEAEKLVNKHLWRTANFQELNQEKVRAQNSYLAPQICDSIWPKTNQAAANHGVDHSPDRNESNAFEDLNRYRKEFQATHPDSIIQGEIADQQKMAEAQEIFRAEYARQFVENARANGYAVELNSDFVVIRVTPISNTKQRNPSLFEGQSDGVLGRQPK